MHVEPLRSRTRGIRRFGGIAVLVAAMVGLPSACGDDEEPADTAAATSTSDAAASTSTTVAPPSSSAPTSTTSGEGVGGTTDAEALADGDHVVYIDAIDDAAPTMTVDLVELLTGQEALDAYLEDKGFELDGEAFYLRNRNDMLRTVAVDPAVGPFSIIDAESCCEPIEVGFAGLVSVQSQGYPAGIGSNPPFTVTVLDGTIIAAVQLYVA